MKIIVTEKPSVARTFAQVLGVRNKEDGYFEENGWIITWCLGHLVTLALPDEMNPELKTWSFDTLPFLPDHYQYHVINDDGGRSKKQFKVIKSLYNRPDIDCIYYAGDPAREGLYIQMLVRQEAGHNPNADERVVWIDSQTAPEIRRGIKEAKPLSAYDHLRDAGYLRAEEDYAVGMNLTRAMTLKYRNALHFSKGSVSVGRVMTCVLGMIVDREREITNFKAKDFYRVNSTIEVNGEKCTLPWKADHNTRLYPKMTKYIYNDMAFLDKGFADNFARHLDTNVTVDSVEQKTKKKSAPLLFNLAELQALCSRLFKISPDKTLEIIQKLYEAKLVTYPRTDSRYLSSAIADEIDGNLDGLKFYAPVAEAVESIQNPCSIKDTKYTDDSKVADHYALIPTGQNVDQVESLDDLSQKVYELIARRFVAIFLPPAEYREVSVSWRDGKYNERFTGTGSALVKPGFTAVWTIGQNQKDALPTAFSELKQGQTYECVYSTEAGKTSPPKRYTSGSMILAMENAGTLIEDEDLRAEIKGSGIGTSATRAETISKLVRIHDINLNTKTQVLSPTANGIAVYEAVKEAIPSLLNPKMTAEWERDLGKVADGNLAAKTYRSDFESFVERSVADIKARAVGEQVKKAAESVKPMANEKHSAPKKSEIATYLNVPFDEKDEAKSIGARWDGDAKCWYAPAGSDLSKFAKWANGSVKSVKKVYLNVPFDDKDEAKGLGARWDPAKKKWYVRSVDDLAAFDKWIPKRA